MAPQKTPKTHWEKLVWRKKKQNISLKISQKLAPQKIPKTNVEKFAWRKKKQKKAKKSVKY